jgi:hypothetical protein
MLFFFIISQVFRWAANRANNRAKLARLGHYQQPARHYRLARYARFWQWASRTTLVVAGGCLLWWVSLLMA